MRINITFRPYQGADYQSCIDIFDANCPTYFALNEREDYDRFLRDEPSGYEVCEVRGCVVGAFGLFDDGEEGKTLNWILLDPRSQGFGIGSAIMERVKRLGGESKRKLVKIAASQKSAPFFAKFGAIATGTVKDGWGPDMDRVDMVLRV